MNYVQFSEEQNKKLEQLKKDTEKKARFLAIKTSLRLILGCGAIIAVNELLVHNYWFVGIMAFVTGMCAGVVNKEELKQAEAEVEAEFNNIVNN